jgi:hypothetical protein
MNSYTNYLDEACLKYSAGPPPSLVALFAVGWPNLPQSANAVTQEFALMPSAVNLHVILFIDKPLQHSSEIGLRLSYYYYYYYYYYCYGSTSLLLGLSRFFSFLILYTVGRTPWTGDQPVPRPLPTHRTTQTQNKRTHRHPCLKWVSNPRSRRSSERRQFMP